MNKGYAQILAAGVYSSIQDKGRFGFGQYGVPNSGYILPNIIDEDFTNAIEFFGTGLTIRFSHDVLLNIVGFGLTIQVDTVTYTNVSVLTVQSGKILKIVKNEGNIGYLCVLGNWQSEYVMKSYSQMKGITMYDRLYPKMVIAYQSQSAQIQAVIKKDSKIDAGISTFNVMPGPEYHRFPCDVEVLTLTIDAGTNRQAICFQDVIAGVFPEIISSYTPIGTIQITKGGKVFILSKDGQTTGGYYRWGFLKVEDLEKLYLKKIGEKIILRIVGV
jgi:allophanate hydrolase subunit 2